jgi:hypothetical protein
MTTIDLYKQLKEGKIAESKFLYEVRRDQNLPWILNTTSFEDAEKILKNKGIIKEWIQEDHKITAIIDRLNPYQFKRAMEFEVSKAKDLNQATYIQLRAKVAKRMANDKSAYREFQEFNAKEIAKEDAKNQMTLVKLTNHVAEYNQMEKIKHQPKYKADHAPKTENRKGKPKNVKEMTSYAKAAKGVYSTLPDTKKEQIVESLFGRLFKKKVKLTEDSHHKFGYGQSVPLPEKDQQTFGCETGIVKDIKGGTLYLELDVTDENGQPVEIARQTNVIEHNMENRELPEDKIIEPVENSHGHSFKTGDTVVHENKETTIKSFKKNQGKMQALIPQDNGTFYNAVDVNDIKPVESDKEYRDRVFGRLPNVGAQTKVQELFNKLKEVSKKNLKKEVVTAKTNTASDEDTLKKIEKIAGPGKEDVKNAFQSGKAINI